MYCLASLCCVQADKLVAISKFHETNAQLEQLRGNAHMLQVCGGGMLLRKPSICLETRQRVNVPWCVLANDH